MSYSIHITNAAQKDMACAADHIEYVLKNPKAADDLLNEAEQKIESLALFPKKFPLIDDPVLSSWGIRYVIIKNYLAFYIVDDQNNGIFVIRFLHQTREWISILKSEILAH